MSINRETMVSSVKQRGEQRNVCTIEYNYSSLTRSCLPSIEPVARNQKPTIARTSSHFVLKLVDAGQFRKKHKKEKIINEEFTEGDGSRTFSYNKSIQIKTVSIVVAVNSVYVLVSCSAMKRETCQISHENCPVSD